MRLFFQSLALMATLSFLSCNSPNIEQAEVRKLLDDYSIALGSKSTKNVADIFHEKAQVMPEGKDIAGTREEIEALFKGLETIDFEENFEIQEMIPTSDLVIVRTLNTGKWASLDQSEGASFTVKGQMVLKKDANGALKIFRYMYNSNPAEAKIGSESIDGGFAHMVYFWLKKPNDPEAREKFEASLTQFIDHSAFIKSKHLGTPADTDRPVIDNSYTYCLIVTFDSKEAHDQYQAEAGHIQFIEESRALWEKVLVYDSENMD